MLVIGLTGGIGSGKTAVSDRFADLGSTIIDTDVLSRELVAAGQPALQEIRQHFGSQVIKPSGELDRKALGARVFAAPHERHRLEQILHPRIRAATQKQLQQLRTQGAAYAIVVIPLLLETAQQDSVDRILVVDTPSALQRQRIQARDGHSQDHIERILKAQTDRETRLASADDLIVNDGDLTALNQAVAALHRKYIALSHDPGNPS